MQSINILETKMSEIPMSNIFLFADPIDSYDKIWIIGDDFVAGTYHQQIANADRTRKLYMENNYNVEVFATRNYCSLVRNPLARIKSQFAMAIKEQVIFP